MKSAWQVLLVSVAGGLLVVGASAASHAHHSGLALLLAAVGSRLLALELWNAGRPR